MKIKTFGNQMQAQKDWNEHSVFCFGRTFFCCFSFLWFALITQSLNSQVALTTVALFMIDLVRYFWYKNTIKSGITVNRKAFPYEVYPIAVLLTYSVGTAAIMHFYQGSALINWSTYINASTGLSINFGEQRYLKALSVYSNNVMLLVFAVVVVGVHTTALTPKTIKSISETSKRRSIKILLSIITLLITLDVSITQNLMAKDETGMFSPSAHSEKFILFYGVVMSVASFLLTLVYKISFVLCNKQILGDKV